MVVKIRLIRCQACLVERTLRILEFQQARRTPLIRLLGNTKGLFRFGQGFETVAGILSHVYPLRARCNA